ncbi:MAG: CHAT domain-containing protein [Planctomycetota bacterium]
MGHPASATDAEVTRLVDEARGLYDKGEYTQAERVARQADAVARRGLAEDDVSRVYVDIILGQILEARGDYQGAKNSYEAGLAWLEKAYGPEHPAVTGPLKNLANVFVLLGDLPRAERAARQAVEINARHPDVGPGHVQTASAMHSLAAVMSAKGDFASAEELLKKTVAIKEEASGPESLDATISRDDLAGLYYERGDYDQAEPLRQRILAAFEKLAGPEHPETAVALNNTARLYRAMGLYERAEPLQRRAGEILERVFPPEHPQVAHAASNLGELLLSVGKQAEARKLFERSAAIRDKVLGPSHPYTSISWQNLAFAAAGGGDWAAAFDAADRGRRGVRRYVARVLPALTDREQLQFLKIRDEANLHGILSLGLVRADDPEAAERSAAWLANAKAVGQEATAEGIQIAGRAQDPGARKAAAELQEIRKELAGLRQAAQGSEQTAARIDQLEERERAAILAMGLSFQWLEREDPWVAIGAIRAALPAASVFVDIARFRPRDFAFAAREGQRFEPSGNPRYVAWIVPPAGRGRIRVIDLGEAAAIDALVAEYRAQIEAAKGPEGTIQTQGEAAAQAELAVVAAPLAKRTIEPLLAAAQEALGKAPQELVISPDGPLWLVPFAALVLADGRFAVEAVAIRHVTSGRDLVTKRAAAGESSAPGVRPPLIMAAPNFDSQSAGKPAAQPAADRSLARPAQMTRRHARAQPLPGTLEEARAVADAVRRIAGSVPEVVVADEATETRFKASPRPALAILATHGFFLGDQRFDPDALAIQRAGDGRGLVDVRGEALENPLTRCGLMLAGCNVDSGGGEDGVLTGLEILGCDLRGTRLVVLSACQTGLGEVESGQGVAGLRQAFQLAGAETVVSTLWSVPDKETAQLSSTMFAALADSALPAEAVRRAQLELIRSRSELLEAAHPFFWAAFTATGR